MNYSSIKKTEALYSNSFCKDSKHILNTSNKVVPVGVLDDIEKEGCSLEQIDKLSVDGLDIFKYDTQITIHGLFPELSNQRLDGYKWLFQNKNKSIGVKWNAVDYAKKTRIYEHLRHVDFSIQQNSTTWIAYKMKRVDTPEDIEKYKKEFKAVINRIDTTKLYGLYDCYMASIYGRVYVVLEIKVNGIYEENVNAFIEQVSGMSISQLDAIIKQKDKEYKAECKARNLRYKEAERKRAELKKQQEEIEIEFIKTNGLPDGFSKMGTTDIVHGLRVAHVVFVEDENKKELTPSWRFIEYSKTKRQRDFRYKWLDENGNDIQVGYCTGDRISRNKTTKGFIKKP